MSNWMELIFGNQMTWALVAYLLGFAMTLGGIPVYTWLERRGAARPLRSHSGGGRCR